MNTSRSASGYGSGRTSTAYAIEKIAVAEPMPEDEQRQRGDREPWRASEDARRVPDVAPGGVEPDRADFADRFCRLRQSTDVPERQPARLVGRHAARAMALHLTLDMVPQLLAISPSIWRRRASPRRNAIKRVNMGPPAVFVRIERDSRAATARCS